VQLLPRPYAPSYLARLAAVSVAGAGAGLLLVASPCVVAFAIWAGGSAIRGRLAGEAGPLLAVATGAWVVGALLWRLGTLGEEPRLPTAVGPAEVEGVFE
jgi:hypothetical protein